MAVDASHGGEQPRSNHAPAFEEKREDEVASLMEISRKLCLVQDPDEEPFRSKYKAREALLKARRSLVDLPREGGGDGESAAAAAANAAGRMALIDYRLGVIALAVEENSAAQEALDKCAGVFFEGVVGKTAAAAGNEEEDDADDGKTADSPPPPPIPTAAPPGMVCPCPLAWDHPEEAADTLTQLGLLWSARGYSRRSILYLLASVGFLREASSSLSCSSPPPPPPPPASSSSSSSSSLTPDGDAKKSGRGKDTTEETEEGNILEVDGDGGSGGGGGDGRGSAAAAAVASAETETGEEGEGGRKCDEGEKTRSKNRDKKAKLESMVTHAFYYLAQAYGVRDVEQSAKYCALTLQRQLDASQRGDGVKVSFDPGEWSRNACFLADYYSGLGRFPEAGRCLLAAQAVLESQGAKPACTTEAKVARPPSEESTAEAAEAAAAAAAAAAANGGSPLSLCPPQPPLPRATPEGEEKEAEEGGAGANEKEEEEKGKAEGTRAAEARDGGEGNARGDEEARRGEGTGQDEAEKRKNNKKQQEQQEEKEEQEVRGGRSGGQEVEEKEKGEEEGEEEEETEEERETRREQRADVDRHMAKLYITVLQIKHQELGSGGGGGEFSRVPRENEDREGEEEEEGGFASGFDRLGVGELPMCDPATVPLDFESARDVFKRAKSHTERALRHYVLDGFVTAHVALQQGLSRAYLYLSGFERDNKRKQAMCTRRAQALEPLLAALAPKAYARLHKELSFELGEIYQDLADIKVLRVQEKASSGMAKRTAALASDLRATNNLLKSAIGFFSHFVAMYHEGDPTAGAPDSPSQPAKGMESVEVVGYLQARFMRARLNGKLQPLSSEKELQALRLSCGEFAWLSEHARGHLKAVRETAGDPGIFEQELDLAEEMAQLQRRNIANVERKLREQQLQLQQAQKQHQARSN